MNKIMALVFAAVICVPAIDNCYAQYEYDMQKEGIETVDGTVVSVDLSGSTITIRSAAGDLAFSVPVNAPVVSGIYDIKLSDIETGQYVSVEHYRDSSGKLIARKITIQNQE